MVTPLVFPEVPRAGAPVVLMREEPVLREPEEVVHDALRLESGHHPLLRRERPLSRPRTPPRDPG